MKNITLVCFILLASACVFAARANEETPAVDAPKMEDQPETADVMADEEQKEDETEAVDAEEDEEDEGDEDETTDVADDEPEKRGWACRRYRKGKLWCKVCGCRRACKSKFCTRRVCKRVRCSRKVCRFVTKYRSVKYKYRNPYYKGSGNPYSWITKRVPYKVRVCNRVQSFCKPKCYNRRYKCGRSCRSVCKFRKCQTYYW